MDARGETLAVADDRIVAGMIVLGLEAILDHLGCSVHKALDVCRARYDLLRRERPDDFTTSRAEYWAHVLT